MTSNRYCKELLGCTGGNCQICAYRDFWRLKEGGAVSSRASYFQTYNKKRGLQLQKWREEHKAERAAYMREYRARKKEGGDTSE